MLKQDQLLPFDSNATWKPKTRHINQSKRRNLTAPYQSNRKQKSDGKLSRNSRVDQQIFKASSRNKCDEKLGHEIKGDAIKSADSYMDRVSMTFSPMVPYYCRHHLIWHTGHDTRFPKALQAKYRIDCCERERIRKETLNF